MDTGIKSPRFTKLLTAFKMPQDIVIKEVEDLIDPRSPALCLMCRTLMAVFISRRQGGADDDTMMDVAVDLCMQTELMTYNVCRGAVNLNANIFLHIVDNVPDLSANNVCGFVFQGLDCTNNDDRQEWNINVSGGGSAITGHKSSIPSPSASDFTVVHISDNHYDTRYIEGGNAVCGEPCCCRSNQVSFQRMTTKGSFLGFFFLSPFQQILMKQLVVGEITEIVALHGRHLRKS